jgi:hypothetical protein
VPRFTLLIRISCAHPSPPSSFQLAWGREEDGIDDFADISGRGCMEDLCRMQEVGASAIDRVAKALGGKGPIQNAMHQTLIPKAELLLIIS